MVDVASPPIRMALTVLCTDDKVKDFIELFERGIPRVLKFDTEMDARRSRA